MCGRGRDRRRRAEMLVRVQLRRMESRFRLREPDLCKCNQKNESRRRLSSSPKRAGALVVWMARSNNRRPRRGRRGADAPGLSLTRRRRNKALTLRAVSARIFLFPLRLRPRTGRWESRLRPSFASPLSFHLSPTRCGPLSRRQHPGGPPPHSDRRRCGTLCHS